MKPGSGPLFALAVIGCFALAFVGAYFLELLMLWVLEVRLKLPFQAVADTMVTVWRGLASLALALFLCMWLKRG